MKIDMHFHVVGRGKDIDQVTQEVFFYLGHWIGPREWVGILRKDI